ncbi:MAG: UDP-N-acetylmuramoyl-tripeptide--D-alanyl-D-alanine ligase [Clostridia bacterium]|nr:UDP-N-acetylmuramoyl-tripeptide--D-alanyl-D-alanine ligase [Clostridia bacterium]
MLFNIVEIVLVTLMSCAASVHYIHVLQMNRYQLPAYGGWLRRNRDRVIRENVVIGFVAAILSLYMPVLLSMFINVENVRRAIANWLTLALFMGVTGFIAWRDYNLPSKKPFVVTHRVRRFGAVLATLCLLAAALLRALTIPPYFLFAAMPYMVELAALIINPYENKLNAGFFKSAKQKIRKHPHLVTIGITGSFGKTNVKFMLRDMLEKKYKVLATPASFNTAMGISRVVNDDLTDAHEVFIAEMGATHVGDIKELVELVRPKYGILTSIGKRHLDTFGSLENIASTKYELIQGLPKSGFAVFGSGDDYIDRLYAMCKKDKCRVSLDPRSGAYMTAEGITYSDRGTSFTLVCGGERTACRTPLLGSFNVKNILLAAAMARRLEVPMEDIAKAIRELKPIEHRLQLTVDDLNVIDDTLNEDPDGAFEAVRVLSQMPGRRIVVTPGMNGLSQQEAEVNYALGTVMADCADTVILVGGRNSQRGMRRGLLQSGFSRSNLHAVEDMDDASELLEEISEHGDTVLFESRVPEFEDE